MSLNLCVEYSQGIFSCVTGRKSITFQEFHHSLKAKEVNWPCWIGHSGHAAWCVG